MGRVGRSRSRADLAGGSYHPNLRKIGVRRRLARDQPSDRQGDKSFRNQHSGTWLERPTRNCRIHQFLNVNPRASQPSVLSRVLCDGGIFALRLAGADCRGGNPDGFDRRPRRRLASGQAARRRVRLFGPDFELGQIVSRRHRFRQQRHPHPLTAGSNSFATVKRSTSGPTPRFRSSTGRAAATPRCAILRRSVGRGQRRERTHFAVQTPFVAAVVKGTIFSVVSNAKTSTVTVQRGKVGVEDIARHRFANITPGQQATAGAGSVSASARRPLRAPPRRAARRQPPPRPRPAQPLRPPTRRAPAQPMATGRRWKRR